MTADRNYYASTIRRPDSVRVRVEITAPADRRDVGDLAEIAQMWASRLDKWLTEQAARDADREAERAALGANTTVPF